MHILYKYTLKHQRLYSLTQPCFSGTNQKISRAAIMRVFSVWSGMDVYWKKIIAIVHWRLSKHGLKAITINKTCKFPSTMQNILS